MILGNKVFLRSPEMSDLQSFYKWHNDEELKKIAMMNPYHVSLELENDWLKNVISDKDNRNMTFVIVERSTDSVLGYSQLKNINWISRNAWFGIIIGNKNKRNMGFGRETTELMIDYAFNSLNLNKLQLEVLEINSNAIDLYLKMNFTNEAQLRQHFFCEGEYLDTVIMSLLREKGI